MHVFKHLRQGVILVASLLATSALACLASTPALAATLTAIWGSGAALQGSLQSSLLIPNAPGALSSDVTYTATTSGKGAEEFGFTNSKLLLSADPTAEKSSAKTLDGFVGTDSPASSTELADATTASGDSSPNTVSVPVAQTPLALLFSFPLKIKVVAKLLIKWTSLWAGMLFAGKVPAATPYPENTWGALLIDNGFTAVLTTPTTESEFEEEGSETEKTGGYTPISIEVRKNGAGTTLNLKQYLFKADELCGDTEWTEPSVLLDENAYGTDEWPTGAKLLPATGGNSTDANEAEAVEKTPGTVGYATLGDARLNKPSGFEINIKIVTEGGSHGILYALVQNNGCSATPEYAAPEGTNEGEPNIYTSKVLINGEGTGPESWTVPTEKNWMLTWFGSSASDPTVKEGLYPIVAVAWDYGWLKYLTTELESQYGSKANAENTGLTTEEYLNWVTEASGGQTEIEKYPSPDSYYYAPLPSNIQTPANEAAKEIGTEP
jgi:hypothetical protein